MHLSIDEKVKFPFRNSFVNYKTVDLLTVTDETLNSFLTDVHFK